MISKIAKFSLRFVKSILKLVGGICFIVGLLITFWYFYIEDHILYVFPTLAREVTLTELTVNPDQYDDKWVRLKGELWHPRRYWATVVPPGTGPEKMTAEEIQALYKRRTDDKHFSNKNTRKSLPEAHATLHAFGRLRTASLLDVARGKVVEIAGEFEKPVWYKGKSSIIDVAAIVEPRQPLYWINVILMGLTSLLCIIAGVAFFSLSKSSTK